MSLPATFRVRWQARALGVTVLALVLGGFWLIAGEDASPWSWIILSLMGAAALLASIANFGEIVEADEAGISQRNVLLGRLGLGRAKKAAWTDVLHAVEQDGATFFLEVQDQPRWVLDQLDDHEHFRLILQDRGITISVRTRPRLAFWRRDHPEGR